MLRTETENTGMARQEKVEVVWPGPAVVHEQCAVSRTFIGHRGARMRKVLFAGSVSDEGSSDGSNGGRVGATGWTRPRGIITTPLK